MMKAILGNRRQVATGNDGKALSFLQRVAPGFGYWVMSAAYRKIADPKLYVRLDALKHKA